MENANGAGRASTALGRRAATAVALLVGFYVLALLVIVGLVAINIALMKVSGRGFNGLVLGSVLIIIGILRGVFAARGETRPEGVEATRSAEPALWALIDEVATGMGTHPPDELILVPEVNAFVYEESALLGLVPRHRGMAIGVALLDALNTDQLRAVLAHEFGHYVGGDTRLGAVTYRGALSLQKTLEHLNPEGLTGKLFGAYARLFWRVSSGVRRNQELRADINAARIAGAEAARTALTELEPASAAYSFFVSRYVAPVWQTGRTPTNIFEGLRDFSQHPRRSAELDEIRAAAASHDETNPYDSHPPLAARLANLAGLAAAADNGTPTPARSLLADPPSAEAAVSRHLAAQATGRPLETMDWDQIPEQVYGAGMNAEAAHLLAAVAAVDGGSSPADLERLYRVVEDGRREELARAYGGDIGAGPPDHQAAVRAAVLLSGVRAVSAAALAAQPQSKWALSWAAPVAVITPSGEHLDVDAWVAPGEADTAELGSLRATLSAYGVDPAWRPDPTDIPQAPEPVQFLGALLNIDVETRGLRRAKRGDGLVFADELLLVRSKMKKLDEISAALSGATGGSETRRYAVQRVRAALSRPPDEVVADDPLNRRIPWEDVQRARLARALGGWRLYLHLRDGEKVTIRPLEKVDKRATIRDLLTAVLGERLKA